MGAPGRRLRLAGDGLGALPASFPGFGLPGGCASSRLDHGLKVELPNPPKTVFLSKSTFSACKPFLGGCASSRLDRESLAKGSKLFKNDGNGLNSANTHPNH